LCAQAGLLPRVVSGTSGGSIVAAIMAMHSDEELLNRILQPSIVSMHGVRFFVRFHVHLCSSLE
jgi:predicted acylesterase/phospholipase RssA